MPVTAQVGRFGGYANIVTHTFGNFLVAARADVTLERFVGLHTTNFNIAI